MERRICRLEATYTPGVDRALLESIAAAEGIDPDELLAEAQSIAADMERHLPKPHTLDRMADYIARRDGLSPQEHSALLVDVQRIASGA